MDHEQVIRMMISFLYLRYSKHITTPSNMRIKHANRRPTIKPVLSSVFLAIVGGLEDGVCLEIVKIPSLLFCINSSTFLPDFKGSKRQIQQ